MGKGAEAYEANLISPKAGVILAFSERPLMAKSCRQRTPSITTGLHPKADKPTLMSVFSLITCVIGGKADIEKQLSEWRAVGSSKSISPGFA